MDHLGIFQLLGKGKLLRVQGENGNFFTVLLAWLNPGILDYNL